MSEIIEMAERYESAANGLDDYDSPDTRETDDLIDALRETARRLRYAAKAAELIKWPDKTQSHPLIHGCELPASRCASSMLLRRTT